VLCVDDDAHVLAALHRQLRSRYDVTIARGGADALARLREDAPFAVVVCDLHMPDMDGLAFLATAATLSPDLVALLMSGDGEQPATEPCSMVFRRIGKPCPPPVLWSALEAALAHHASRIDPRSTPPEGRA
jgi:CheY-like chemotaxis protein